MSLVGSKRRRLRVGVIGLGRLWEARHKPALARLADRFEVVAVYDQSALRAALEARQLGCTACEGLTELIGRSDVDVVSVLTEQWFGLHPVELACQFGKPVYCALPPAADPEGFEAVAGAIRSSGLPFMPELARRFYPATERLRELLDGPLGPPRLITGHARLFGFDRYSDPGPSTQLAPVSLMVDPGGNLVDWCRFLFRAEPVAVQASGTTVLPGAAPECAGPDFASLTLEFPAGGLAQIQISRYHRAAWGEASRILPAPGFQVLTERGAAWVELPDRVQWSSPEGRHDERLPMEPTVGERLCDQFGRFVRGEAEPATSLDDALAVARLVRRLGQSQRDGSRIVLQGGEEPTPDGPDHP